MRAIILPEHGTADSLRYVTDHPKPETGRGEVLIRVYAAALNRLDIWVRDGWPGIKLPLPHILGADAAGVIEGLGEGVEGLTVGTRCVIDPMTSCGMCEFCRAGKQNLCEKGGITGEHHTGTYCEYITISARNVLPLPDSVGFAEAAAAALVNLTAWHSLITRGGLTAGQSVLIVGAGGGVNSASIQIAKLAGATVYVVGSSAAKLKEAEQLGADVLIDRSAEDWAKAVFKATGRQGVDLVVDNVGKDTLFSSIRSVKRGGKLLIVGNTSGAIAEIDLRYVFSKQIEIIGSTMAPHADFVTVMKQVFAGRLKPTIGARFPLEAAAQAHVALESGAIFGKIVLDI